MCISHFQPIPSNLYFSLSFSIPLYLSLSLSLSLSSFKQSTQVINPTYKN